MTRWPLFALLLSSSVAIADPTPAPAPVATPAPAPQPKNPLGQVADPPATSPAVNQTEQPKPVAPAPVPTEPTGKILHECIGVGWTSDPCPK